MNGYARIKSFHTINESSNVVSSLQSNETNDQNILSPREIKTHDSEMKNGDAFAKKGSFGNSAPKFQRTCSVSSSMQSMQKMATVKRAFSMRRSSSVSEGYCRIHDQHVALESPMDGEDEDSNCIGSARKERRGKRVLKACKRIFRL